MARATTAPTRRTQTCPISISLCQIFSAKTSLSPARLLQLASRRQFESWYSCVLVIQCRLKRAGKFTKTGIRVPCGKGTFLNPLFDLLWFLVLLCHHDAFFPICNIYSRNSPFLLVDILSWVRRRIPPKSRLLSFNRPVSWWHCQCHSL